MVASVGEHIFRSFSRPLLTSPREKTRPSRFPLPGVQARTSSWPISFPNRHGEEENSMQSKKQFCNLISRIISRAATAALAMATVFALTVVLTQSAQAQTFKVIHAFTGGGDGEWPYAGLTIDQAGNLYGTAPDGVINNSGLVFRLSKKGSNWILNPLYDFLWGNDGSSP